MSRDITSSPNKTLSYTGVLPALLDQIRPHWQAKDLIERVRRLLPVDPSSACQRLLNASIHDLREKVIIAGLDIAEEAAKQNKLPPVTRAQDVEDYSTAKLLDLAFHMGLLSRAEWRRICRCYEIRRDLEHEDDEYEAQEEDCIYIFKTCIESILAIDPIRVLKIADVLQLIEQPSLAAPSQTLLADYECAPQPRQEEIMKFLTSIALDKKKPDIVQQNAFVFISQLQAKTHNNVKVNIGTQLQERVGRDGLDERIARVAQAAGVFIYLRQSARTDFFETLFSQMDTIGSDWSAYNQHGEILRSFKEFGGLAASPNEPRLKILKWLVLTYIGTPGGHTQYGNIRHVFYSNTAAPLVKEIISEAAALIKNELKNLSKDKDIKKRLENQHIARRYETLLDLISEE